ncbi:LysM peptidoglycan-binding domain-containing protein [Dyella sp. LX-66]|uniref:LysM peptidoglycan-binding domain-containing protein n=1 Tax=unclassified Dyella TaxID=2634549 RepID=UPI001BDF913B|nr:MULTISPECIES: LysM peptidoglycan-binding domain-containing protein [unclassified Dyella]MBT2117094.1 LysM peptidoglycan-binding domain-containing protein [Dyella sp. LX-1]MBT2139830.1 LysM peptidoglycan-binding domain-containing protein [Dyella sp. LX-66]
MASTAIQNLQAALKASVDASTPFALDAAYLTAGMADPAVQVPASYDADLAKAFQVKTAADFKVSAKPGSVGPIGNDSFSVQSVSLPFIGVQLSGTGKLTFSLSADGATLVIAIESKPAGWTWTTSFPRMTGWQFKVLPVSSATFTFLSSNGPRQSAAIGCGVPASATPLFTLFDPIIKPPALVTLRGDLDLSTYNNTSVLFPSGDLRGSVSDGSFSLIYLQVSKPAIALKIPPPADAQGKQIADTQQTPQLSISTELKVDGASSAFLLEVALPQQADGRVPFDMSLRALADSNGPQLTPSTMLALAGGAQSGGRSYLSSVPPVLQQFMTSVSLRGLALAGIVGSPPALSRIGLQIGSVPGMHWTPLPDAPPGLDFTFTSFALDWSLIDPFNAATRQQAFQFSTQFTLAPAIFKGKKPGTDGLFTVSFGSDLQFAAGFAGTASLRDFVDVLSGGSITLPDGVNASVSDITATVDYPERSFTFGSGFDVEVSFLEVGGKPILAISDGRIDLAAMTPTQGDTQNANGDQTQWQASIGGTLSVGPVGANVLLAYDGFSTPASWALKAQLAESVKINAVIRQFFDPYGSYDFPDFLPGDVELKTFVIDAKLASKGGKPPTTYTIDTTFSWLFDLGEQRVGINPAHLMIAYDGAKPASQQFSGLAEGTWVYTAINLELKMGYQFQPTAEGPNDTLYLEWEGFRATYETGKEQITFSLKGWTVGTLIQALVRTLGDPYFTLASPWDLLNQISLDGLSLIVSLKSGVKNRLSAAYTLSSPLNLGFIVIKSLIFRRDTDGKVTLAIDGTVPSPLQGTMGDLLDPAKGQDVQNMPSVPGAGQEYFKLYLLALGQRIGITGYQGFATTQEAILALEGVPNTIAKQNPVNPTANEGTSKGIPYYDPANHWLIAGHMGVLKIAGVWTVDVKVVFNDPNLYGLRLALAGPRAGGLAGLVVDIIYKKITDDIGLFQLEFTFPDSIRNLNFGAVSVVLPQIGIQVYTNGDFLIDIGFPYNLDFRRSFSISAIVYGVPVLGSGGLYFGKLSGATATQVPRTDLGTFNPVIVFGLGLQLGLGYNFVKGPLQAGFALTVFGIIEGVIAAWHPYKPAQSASRELMQAGSGSLQDEYYFKISGTVGIIGLLYGKVDFAIIQASVNVNITLSLKITYESYRAIPLIATARVDISLKVKINLGLFSISISLSFAMTVTASFVIGSDSKAPWDSPRLTAAAHARRRQLLTEGPAAIRARAKQLRPQPRRLAAHLAAAADKPTLHVVTAPQYTVLAAEKATDPSTQQGAFVFLFAMDAPTIDGAATGQTSFDLLCNAYFPWLIDALGGDPAKLSRADLETFIARIADLDDPALSTKDLLGFLADHFTFDIATTQASTQQTRDALAAGAMLFPVFDGLSLSVPDPDGGSGSKPIAFETYATATPTYRRQVSETFAKVAVQIGEEQSALRATLTADTPESMASLVFGDTFSIVGRQLLQAALDALDAYVYKLSNSSASPDSIGWIIDWANQRGNDLLPEDVALPNQDHPLNASTRLTLAGLSSTIQASDTLRSVATRYSDAANPARWTTPAASLVTGNGDARVLRIGVPLKLTDADNQTVDYTTTPGDSFAAIARTLRITLDALSTQANLLDASDLLAPAAALAIPSFAYTCAEGDTLASIATQFATTVPVLADSNLQVAGLFSLDANGGALSLANLSMLPAADLWTAIQATDQVAMTAGMVSRFLMFGLRLPTGAGLSLSQYFLYLSGQSAYGLYQLTGQQFPVPAKLSDGNYKIQVLRADASHEVPLTFVHFNGAPGKDAEVELSSAWNLLDIVVSWAKTGAFQPAPGFEALPLADTAPRAVSLGNPALWSTSDRTALGLLTDRGQGPGNPLAQPTWWSLPGGFVAETAARQAALAPVFPTLTELMQRMPRYLPSRVVNSASGAESTVTPLTAFAWATRVDVQIKRMPAQSLADAQPQGEGSVPSGPALAASLPNVYELVAPASEVGAQLAGMMRAMAALGPSLTSGVSLLYSQATGAAAGSGDAVELVSLGAAEFLSFITQTNLSTEANPMATLQAARLGEIEAPHGIANSPSELARLLWELSVVRSGGYFLYYRVLDGDAGLPASLFDANGTATLSFVFTLAAKGGASIGDTPLDFVNGFVTTDDIDRQRDIVELVAQTANTTSKPLDGQASLAMLAATYGISPGRIASGNPSAVVTASTQLTIAGIQRQLGPADVANPATTLETLATYYSQGAATPITAADIVKLNPGVAVALGAVFFIPAVEYVVAANAKPGQTLGSIANYYGLSLDALAVLIAAVPRLLMAGTVLNLDTQALEPRSTIGPANLGIALERANLGQPSLPVNPTPGDKETFARASMYALYNTLSAGFAANAYFTASPLGLPFGPQADAAGATPAHPLRAAAHRRDRLAAALEEDFRYRQMLGLGTFAKVNPAIDAPYAPAADNPYVGVGTPAQIALQWQDLFGNTTITPFTKVPPGYTGAINGEAVAVRYRDTLVNPSGWPQALLYYNYSGDAGSAMLEIELQLSVQNYTGQLDQARRDLALYQLVYYQLHQDYSKKNVPNIDGNAVSIQLANSLLAQPLRTLSDSEAGVIRGFVAACAAYLAALVGSAPLPAAPKAKLSVAVDPAALAAGDLIELDLSLSLTRQPLLVDPEVATLPGGLSVDCPVLPKPDGGESIAYTDFAKRFETVFQDRTWRLRVGEGLRAQSDAGNANSRQLWAVRFGAGGIGYKIGDASSYYAPRPIARALVNRSATLTQYPGGDSITSAFTGVDQNLWFQTVLDAIDTFLSGPTSTSVYVLDALLGADDPLIDGYLGKVLAAKQSLADSISASVAPILSTSADDSSSLWAAQTTLRQQLLAQLGPAYAAGATLVFGLDNVTGGSGDLPPRLYGQPRATLAANSANENYSLSPARLPLGPTTVDGNTYAPRLAFGLTTKNVSGQAYIPLDLHYQISHMEFGRSAVPGIDGYLQSQWLAFVSGPIDTTLGASTSNVPVVNRALPVPPSMTLQTGDKLHDEPASADQLPLWTYRFSYAGEQAAQDLVCVTIELNAPIDNLFAPRANAPDLFTALAQFVSSYPAVSADMALSLPAIGAGTADEATVELAQRAVQAFQQQVSAVAAAHAAGAPNAQAMLLVEAPARIEITMNTRLDRTGQDEAISEILDLQINSVAATWNAAAGTISNGSIVLPAPWIEIAPETYEAEPVSPPPANVAIAYRYRDGEGNYLSFDEARAIATRSVAMEGLNVLMHQHAWSSLLVERNRILTPIADAARIKTREDFVFQTPTVKFANPLVPRLEYTSFPLDGVAPPTAGVGEVLGAFYAALFTGGNGTIDTSAAMTGAYSYRVIPGVPRTVLPISMVPPMDTPVTPTPAPAFVAPFAGMIDEWLAIEDPTRKGDAQLNYTLTLFATTAARQPLLVVSDLWRTMPP